MSTPISQRNPPSNTVSEVFDHISFITSLASWILPNIYLEYGVADGKVLSKVAPYAKRAIGVDLNNNLLSESNIEMHIMPTSEFKEILLKENMIVDMAFIDADHRSTSAYKDFEDIYPHLIENGFIFMHDTYPTVEYLTADGACSDSWKIPDMIKKNYPGCEVLTIPICPGLTICKKMSSKLPWEQSEPPTLDFASSFHSELATDFRSLRQVFY